MCSVLFVCSDIYNATYVPHDAFFHSYFVLLIVIGEIMTQAGWGHNSQLCQVEEL